METVKAMFDTRTSAEQAVHALKEQGALDVRVTPAEAGMEERVGFGFVSQLSEAINGGEYGCVIEAVVESSRLRQAQDTIARYGGQRE